MVPSSQALFMQQSFVSTQTNKYNSEKKYPKSDSYCILIHATYCGPKLFYSLLGLWFIYEFMICIFSPFFFFFFYSILSDWIIISVDRVLHVPRDSWHQFVLIRLRCIVHSIRFVCIGSESEIDGEGGRMSEWVTHVCVCVLCTKLN